MEFRIATFVETDLDAAIGRRSYLVPLTREATSILSIGKDPAPIEQLRTFLHDYGYGQLRDSVDGSEVAYMTNAVMHPGVIVRVMRSKFFLSNMDLIPFFNWEGKNYLCLVLDGENAGSIVVGKRDRRRVAASLEEFMERMADDPAFFLPKWDISGDVGVKIDMSI